MTAKLTNTDAYVDAQRQVREALVAIADALYDHASEFAERRVDTGEEQWGYVADLLAVGALARSALGIIR